MTAEVEAKLNSYVMAVDTEIAGMGKVRVSEEGDIMLLDVAIYDQTVTGGTADLSSEALARFQMELIQKGESPKDWTLWWHSHASMTAFFSNTDTGTIDASTEYQYLVSLVVNRRRERRARLDLYEPFRFTQYNLAIIVGTAENVIPEEIIAEVAEKVKVKKWSWERRSPYQDSLGFGKDKLGDGQHGYEGKAYPASSDDDYDDLQSGVKTEPQIIKVPNPSYLDREEILAIIDALREQLREKIREGKEADDEEISDLNDQLLEWREELQNRDDMLGMTDRVRSYYDSKN